MTTFLKSVVTFLAFYIEELKSGVSAWQMQNTEDHSHITSVSRLLPQTWEEMSRYNSKTDPGMMILR